MAKKRCGTCRWFDPYWEEGDQPPYTGDCYRYPPTLVVSDKSYETPADTDLWSVPHVGAFYCCGEWKKRKNKHDRH